MAYITQPNQTITPADGWVNLGEKPIIQMLFGDVLVLQSQTTPPDTDSVDGKRLNAGTRNTSYVNYTGGTQIYARALNQDAVISVDAETA